MDTIFSMSDSSLLLPITNFCLHACFVPQLLCGLHNRLFVKHTVQQLYPHGLIPIAKGQVHPLLINLNGAQAHAMYPIETPPVNFTANEDTKGRYHGFLSVSLPKAAFR